MLLLLLQVWATPTGIVLCADERFRDWFGVPSKELVGRSISSLSTDIEGFDRCGKGGVLRQHLQHLQHQQWSLLPATAQDWLFHAKNCISCLSTDIEGFDRCALRRCCCLASCYIM
jgi:hypothetical protein